MLPEALRVGPRSHYPRLVVFRGMRTSNGHPAGVRPRREMVAPYTLRELERLEKADMRRQSDDQSESLYNVFALRDENGGPPPPLSRCPVLVLNADRRPLTLFPVTFVNWFQGFRAALRNKVRVESYYDVRVVTTGNEQFRLPAVVSVLTPVPGRPVLDPKLKPFRRNVFLRDDYRCCYCGRQFCASELTVDHLIPQCLGGDSSWDNLASACKSCNSTKGSKLPQQLHELDMQLLKRPGMPTPIELRTKYMNYLPEQVVARWRHFLDDIEHARHPSSESSPSCDFDHVRHPEASSSCA